MSPDFASEKTSNTVNRLSESIALNFEHLDESQESSTEFGGRDSHSRLFPFTSLRTQITDLKHYPHIRV